MDAALGRVGPGGAVERDDDGEGSGSLAVGTVVVGVGVLDPVVAVRVDLRDPGHPFGAQMAAGCADRVSRYDVVPGPQNRIGDDDGHHDVHLVVRGGAGVPGLVDAEPVEVRNALDTWIVLGEQVEHGLPEGVGDADLNSHAASTWADVPRYAGLLRAVWMRLRVASTRSVPARHFWFSFGAWLEV